jgi:hypothetical protein
MGQVPLINKADLGSKLSPVLDAVRQGEVVPIDGEGEPEAAIVDLIDHRILRAVARYHADPTRIQIDADGPPDDLIASLDDPQERFDMVIAYYLAGAANLSRVAGLLGQPWIVMRDRFHRLGVPLRLGPATIEEAREEVRVARALATKRAH